MKPERFKFSYQQTLRWRTVPASSTRKAAGACQPGSDFKDSSKSDIYNTFERGLSNGSRSPDRALFAKMMDELEIVHYQEVERLLSRVNTTIKSLKP